MVVGRNIINVIIRPAGHRARWVVIRVNSIVKKGRRGVMKLNKFFLIVPLIMIFLVMAVTPKTWGVAFV